MMNAFFATLVPRVRKKQPNSKGLVQFSRLKGDVNKVKSELKNALMEALIDMGGVFFR